MAPTYAVPAMLRDAGLTLQDFDYYEISRGVRGTGVVHAESLGSTGLLPRCVGIACRRWAASPGQAERKGR